MSAKTFANRLAALERLERGPEDTTIIVVFGDDGAGTAGEIVFGTDSDDVDAPAQPFNYRDAIAPLAPLEDTTDD